MAAKSNIWRASATLILAAKSKLSQPTLCNYQLLCLKRSSKSKFMPGTYVFPGGNVCSSDKSTDWFKLYENFGFGKQSFDDLRPVENIPTVLQNDEPNSLPKYLSFRICAIRETFEESGVLLCKSPKINDTVSKWASFTEGREVLAWQHRVHDDPDEFLNMCKQFEILPDVWALKNWSNWKTPVAYKMAKFDTIFFLATLHQMPTALQDEREIQDLMWTTPEQAIQLNNEESVWLPPPQFYEMSRLKHITDIEALADFAIKRDKHGFETYWPHRLTMDDGMCTVLPGDDLYPDRIDPNDPEVPHMPELPASPKQHRIFHKTLYSNVIHIGNFTSKCNHILPISTEAKL